MSKIETEILDNELDAISGGGASVSCNYDPLACTYGNIGAPYNDSAMHAWNTLLHNYGF